MKLLLSDEEIHRRAKLGVALNLKQLSVATGYGYSTVRDWHKKGMPMIDGKITRKEALAWRKKVAEATTEELQSENPSVAHHPLLAAGR